MWDYNIGTYVQYSYMQQAPYATSSHDASTNAVASSYAKTPQCSSKYLCNGLLLNKLQYLNNLLFIWDGQQLEDQL